MEVPSYTVSTIRRATISSHRSISDRRRHARRNRVVRSIDLNVNEARTK